jgi:hypothetical protein
MLRADDGQLLPGTGFDAGMCKELIEVAGIGLMGMLGVGAEHPRLNGPRHLLAEVGMGLEATGTIYPVCMRALSLVVTSIYSSDNPLL